MEKKNKEKEELLIENKSDKKEDELTKNGLQNEPKSYINCGCCQITIGIILTYIYIFTSIFLNLNNRVIYHKYNFRNNFTLLLIQQFFSLVFFLLCNLSEYCRQKTGEISFNDFCKFKYYYLSFSFIFICNMISSFYGNQIVINVSMYVTLRKLVLVMIFFLDFFIYKKPIKLITIFCIFLITIGTILVSMDDFTIDYFGFLVVMINNKLTIIFVKFSENFRKKTGVQNLKLLVYNIYISLPMLIIGFIVSKEYKKIYSYFNNDLVENNFYYQLFFFIFISGSLCVILNSSFLLSNEKNSSLFTQLLSNSKDIIMSLLSYFVLKNNEITIRIIIGLLISTTGALIISMKSISENLKFEKKEENKEKEENEEKEFEENKNEENERKEFEEEEEYFQEKNEKEKKEFKEKDKKFEKKDLNEEEKEDNKENKNEEEENKIENINNNLNNISLEDEIEQKKPINTQLINNYLDKENISEQQNNDNFNLNKKSLSNNNSNRQYTIRNKQNNSIIEKENSYNNENINSNKVSIMTPYEDLYNNTEKKKIEINQNSEKKNKFNKIINSANNDNEMDKIISAGNNDNEMDKIIIPGNNNNEMDKKIIPGNNNNEINKIITPGNNNNEINKIITPGNINNKINEKDKIVIIRKFEKKNNNNEIILNNNNNPSNKIINNKDNSNSIKNNIIKNINKNSYDEQKSILKFGNKKNSYYDKIIQLEQKDKLNKIRLIQKQYLKHYYLKKFNLEELKKNLKNNENEYDTHNLKEEIRHKKNDLRKNRFDDKNELQFSRNKSFDIVQNKSKNEILNKKRTNNNEYNIPSNNRVKNVFNKYNNYEEEDEKIDDQNNDKRNVSLCKSVDETESSKKKRTLLLKNIIKKQNKKYMTDLSQHEKNFKEKEITKQILINYSKKFLPNILIKIFNLHLEKYFIKIINYNSIQMKRKTILLKLFKKFNKLRRYLYKWLGVKKINVIINSKLSDSFKKRRLINLLRTINKIFYSEFYYRLILLYLFKNNLDLNSNILITFLNKGFNHKYLFTLYNALSLNLTQNSNYPESNHSFVNYISTIDKMNNPTNKEIINKYFNENPKQMIYKKKSITNKSFDKKNNLSVDENDIH